MPVKAKIKLKKKYILVTFCFILFQKSFSQQKDTIIGNVKNLREKVIFLTEKENPQLLYYDDYGHSGFMGPESTILRFENIWFSTEFCYFINYKRNFDRNGKILEDIWFTKKDSMMETYKYQYDKENRLIRKIDSSQYAVGTETHYYTNKFHENIIYEHFEYKIFSYNYKRYDEQGKLIRSKSYDDYGNTDEYIYKYNDDGQLLYRIYKNPKSWRKSGERSWSYGVQDSVGTIYKDLINKYDYDNRLISSQNFNLYEDDNHEEPKLTRSIFYKYLGKTLYQVISSYSNGSPRYDTYVYDSNNKLIEKYCCSEKKSDSKRIEKYSYNANNISSLIYQEESSPNKIKEYNIRFKYKYDTEGNWTEITKIVDGIMLYKRTREFEYYE